jgi:hypothetical protein
METIYAIIYNLELPRIKLSLVITKEENFSQIVHCYCTDITYKLSSVVYLLLKEKPTR